MRAKNKRRVFIIEPNLRGKVGHSFDFIKNTSDLLKKKGIEVIVVLNKDVPEGLIPDAVRIITNNCFENLNSEGEKFRGDLEELNRLYQFNITDKVLLPTSYTNELAGIRKFLRNHNSCPMFTVVIHQLYSPSNNFYKGHRIYKRKWQEKKLQQLIQALSGRANLFCTSSEKLWVKLSRNGKYNIKMISFPYSTSAKKCLKSKYDLVFLGDNRFEKSLYLLADYLVNNTQTKALLQVTPAKGYPEAFRLALEKDLETLQTNKRVEVMFGGLAKEVLEEAICSSRVVVLPYHPLSYKRRTSALMALAILFEKPVISSHGTWAGDIVEEKLLGTTFIFEKNRKKNLENFTKAVRQIEDNYEGYQSNVRKCRLDWEKEYSYQTFLKKAKVVND